MKTLKEYRNTSFFHIMSQGTNKELLRKIVQQLKKITKISFRVMEKIKGKVIYGK